MTIRPRRSMLYMPGSNARAIEKARELPADGVILDLEDAVAPDAKAQARELVVQALQKGGFGGREVLVRINGLDTAWWRDDLAVAAAGPDALLLPKVSTPGQLRELAKHFVGVGAEAGRESEETNRCGGTRRVDGAHDIVRPVRVGTEARLADSDLVVAQAGDAAVRQLFGQLPHVANGTNDRVVAVTVGRPAFGDQQHRGSGPGVVPVAIGAVNGQAVGDEVDLVIDQGMLIRRAAGQRQHQRNGKNNKALQRRTSIQDTTSSSTTARSGSLNTSW